MSRQPPSPFAVRGVVEGFYGNPWTHEQRLEMLRFIASRGMNTFVYTPKDDPLLRRDWRAPYEGAQLRRLAELIKVSRAVGVEFVFCLSPGLSIRYADEGDLEALTSKLASVETLGVTAFGLLFDDIPDELQHAEDRQAFETLADAHVAVANRVAERLGSRARVVVCPTAHWGTGREEYLSILGSGLEPGIDLFWTGRATCSPTLDADDAAVFEKTARRPATYWDNYPVNDLGMGFELHLGPYRGRDPHLFRHAFGVVANGMELHEASKIPFATIADYLNAPESYDAERSWRRAIRDVAGPADHEAFALFADNVRTSCLATEDAPIVRRALERFAFETAHGDPVEAADGLAALSGRLQRAADHLLGDGVENAALIAECRPWLEAFEVGARALASIASLAAARRLDVDGPAELRPWLVELRRRRVRVFGDVLERTLSDLTGTHVRPGELTLEA